MAMRSKCRPPSCDPRQSDNGDFFNGCGLTWHQVVSNDVSDFLHHPICKELVFCSGQVSSIWALGVTLVFLWAKVPWWV